MKKVLLFVLVVILALSMFASGPMMNNKNPGNNNPNVQNQQGMHPGFMMGGGRGMKGPGGFPVITEEVKQYLISKGVTAENVDKAKALLDSNKTVFDKAHIDIQQKELDLQKLMLDTTKNWTAIEKTVKDIAAMKADLQIKHLKLMDEISKYIPQTVMPFGQGPAFGNGDGFGKKGGFGPRR